jgi:hypothetical protein
MCFSSEKACTCRLSDLLFAAVARFKQQQLPAWQPILTPLPVIVTFFCVALVFLPIGIALLLASNSVRQLFSCLAFGVLAYTDVCCDSGHRGLEPLRRRHRVHCAQWHQLYHHHPERAGNAAASLCLLSV